MKLERRQSELLTLWVASVATIAAQWPTTAEAAAATAQQSHGPMQGQQQTGTGHQQRERRQVSAALVAAPSAKSNKKTKAFELECLAAHNKWRRLHQAPELVFDKKISLFSQKRADFIAASDGDEFKHPPDLPYGENLAWHSRPITSCADLVKMWYDEVELYDFEAGQFNHETGHFTQLVWRNTERVGCARAYSQGPKGGIYLVCNYDPPGNFLGEALDNVWERRQLSAPLPVKPSPAATATATTAANMVRITSPTTSAPTTSSTTTTLATTTTGSGGTSKPQEKPKNKNKKKGKKKDKKKDKRSKGKGKKKNKKKKKNNNNNNNSTVIASTTTPSSVTVLS